MSNLQVVIPLFPKFTALDGIGPYEVLQRIPSIDVTFIGHDRGEIRSENGFLGITADGTLYLDAFPVTVEQLTSLLGQYKAANPNLPVVLKGDAAAPYEKILEVLAAVKKLDIAEVGLVTKRTP